MLEHIYTRNERVKIVGGSYVSHGFGTFLRDAGQTKAAVRIDNDSVRERNLLRSSIRPLSQPTQAKAAQGGIRLSRQEHKELVEMATTAKAEVDKLRTEIDKLTDKLAAVGLASGV